MFYFSGWRRKARFGIVNHWNHPPKWLWATKNAMCEIYGKSSSIIFRSLTYKFKGEKNHYVLHKKMLEIDIFYATVVLSWVRILAFRRLVQLDTSGLTGH